MPGCEWENGFSERSQLVCLQGVEEPDRRYARRDFTLMMPCRGQLLLLWVLLFSSLILTAVPAAGQTLDIAAIRIDGNNRVATSRIEAAMALAPTGAMTLAEVDAAIHRIFDLQRFSDVRAELDSVQGGTVLTFVVEELPLVRRIEFAGNDELSRKKLRPLLSMRIPSLYNRDKIETSIEELRAKYIEEGFHAVRIESRLDVDADNEATLIFDIEEGDKVLIGEIRFIGNTVFDKGDLLKKMESRERWFLSWLTGRGAYLQDTMELDIERIKAAYHDVGYQDVKVKPAQVTLVEDEYLDIEIEIDEGGLYRVGELTLSGDLMAERDKLLERVTLKPGDVFSRTELRNSLLALTDAYANRGYAHANVVPLTDKHPDRLLIDLNLEVEQGVQVYVEKIRIRGNTKTRDKVIRRQIPVLEGSLYSAKQVKEANRRIRNLGFFDEVNITEDPGSAEDQTVLNVDVTEKPTGTFSIGVGYSSVDKLIAQGSVSQDNFLGYGVKLRVSGTLGSTSTTYSLGVTDPYFLDTNWTLGGEIYKSEREYSDYDDFRTGGAIRAGHPVSLNSKAYLTYRYEQKEITNLDPTVTSPIILDAEGESTLSSITAEWVRNSTDYYEDPSRGGITKLSLEYAGLGGTEHFLKSIAEHRHFFPLFWGTVFSIHGEVGYVMETSDDAVPLGEKFFLGGIRTLRGFKTREVGPTDPDDPTEFIGGEKMGYFNFEYLFPIAQDLGLKGVLFYDTGNAWREEDEYFSDMRNSVGAGIRWLSPLGPLRFEWGYNLSPREGEKQSVFEFTIGRAF